MLVAVRTHFARALLAAALVSCSRGGSSVAKGDASADPVVASPEPSASAAPAPSPSAPPSAAAAAPPVDAALVWMAGGAGYKTAWVEPGSGGAVVKRERPEPVVATKRGL